MFTPLILFVGLLIATAVIAYWSDNLGKKLGKKRVSLLGMRPRTTATFLTITSSWAIMVFTLAALLAVAAPLRRALFRYEAERAQYREDIAKAERRLVNTGERFTQSQKSLSDIQKNLHETEKRVRDEQKKTRKIGEARKKAEAARKGAEAARKRAEAGRKIAQASLKKAQAGVAAAQGKVATAQQQFEAAQRRFKAAQRREKAAQRGEKTAQRGKKAAKIAADAARVELKATQQNLQTSQQQLSNTLASLQQAQAVLGRVTGILNRISPDLLKLEKQRSELQRQVAELGRAAEVFSETAAQFAGGEVQIRVNQTFAARLIAPNQTPQNIAATVRDLFEQAQRSFGREQQATSPSSSPQARLLLLPLPDPEKAGKNIVFLEGEQIFGRLARDIAAQRGPTSVRLVAARNFWAGETEIAVRFIVVPVAVAFSAGEPLASMIIDGGAGDARIFNQLFTVLIEMGRREAEKRGVNPPQSPDEPNFFAAGTNVALFEALRRIEASKSPQRVTLVAAKELSTVEPLRVRFEVAPAAPSS